MLDGTLLEVDCYKTRSEKRLITIIVLYVILNVEVQLSSARI